MTASPSNMGTGLLGLDMITLAASEPSTIAAPS